MTITKSEIITRICEKTNVSKERMPLNFDEHTFEIVKASLQRGEQVKIHGFGTFAVGSKRQRKGRNPKTGAEIVIPARNVLGFKATATMK